MLSIFKKILRFGGFMVAFSIFSSSFAVFCEYREGIGHQSAPTLEAVNSSALKIRSAINGAIMLFPKSVSEPLTDIFTAIDRASAKVTEYLLITLQSP